MNGTVDTGAEDTTVDHTVTAVASGGSRRAVVRSLAAGLLAVASGGIATDAPAKKKRKQKKSKKEAARLRRRRPRRAHKAPCSPKSRCWPTAARPSLRS